MTTRLSQFNNTGIPLPVGITFTGAFERTLTGLEISTFVNSSGLCLVTIEQSIDATNVRITTTFNYDPVNDVSTFSVPVGLPFFRVKVFNGDIAAQAYLSLNTYIINSPPTQVNVAGGSVSIAGTVDVDATNLITETLAKRRVDFLVIGDWYRVASIGITSGAEWNQIGAIVNGESVPVIGRLFKCLQAGPAVAGGGECYDVEYTDDVSATVTNLITETLARRRVDFLVVGDYYRVASIGITSGAEWNQIGAIVNGESVPVIGRLFKCLQAGPAVAGGGECYDVEYTDAVSATISNFPAVQAVSGTVSLTDPTTVRVRDSNADPILTTAGNLMVGIGNIYTANPLHTIVDSGTIGLSTSANTVKIDQTSISTNGVRTIAPDTSSVRVTTAGSTGVEVNQGGHLLSFLAVNTSATADAYVKLYDSVSAPIPATDVPFMIAHVSRDAASRLPTLQVDTSNLKVTNKLFVRAVTGSADNNTDVTGLSMDITFFVTAT